MILDCDLSLLPIPFQERIGDTTDCWIWTGNLTSRDKRAYVWWKGKTRIATRALWEYFNGPIPEGLCVLHTCDNPKCVNPKHLYLGTQKDNAQDRKVRDRNNGFKSLDTKGEGNSRAKLKEVQVLEILSSNETHSTLASRYGVSRTTIGAIKTGKNWSYLKKGGGVAYDSRL